MKGPLQLEPTNVFIENEHGQMERAAWVHVSLEQVATVFPHVKYSHHCETPRCKHLLKPAVMFHAVFFTDRINTWVSCWECYQLMLNPQTGV